jgi:carbon monoxide dehydrogenase subunit G
MTQITKQIEVAALPQAVWAVLADFGGVANWAPLVRESHYTTRAHTGVGCRRSVTDFNGRTVEDVVSAWDEGHSMAFRVRGQLAGVVTFLEETWTVEPASRGAQVVAALEYRTKLGLGGAILTRLLVYPGLAKMLARNLAALKRYVEANVKAGDGTPRA